MSTKACIICGYYSSRPFCPSCEERAIKYFDKICLFIKESPKPTVLEVYGETFIPLKVIYGLKDMGLLDIVPGNGRLVVNSQKLAAR